MPRFSVTYEPSGPTLSAFHRSDAFVRILMGPIGSGKTTSSLLEILRRSMEQAPNKAGLRRTRWAIIRNTYGELMSTTLRSWREWCPTDIGEFKQGGPTIHRVRSEVMDMEVLFIALDRDDDTRKLLSLELTGAFINEAREVPRSVLDALTGRVGRYPARRDGGPTWSGIIADTNPPDEDHWIAQVAEDTPEGWAFFKQPGGVIQIANDQWAPNPDAENRENLPPTYYPRAMSGKDDDWIRVYLAGQFGLVREGKPVFAEYRDDLHAGDIEAIDGLPLLIGVDFGLTPAAVITQRAADGRWLILDELIAEDCGIVRFAEVLNRFLADRYPTGNEIRGYGDPAGMQRAQTDERTAMSLLSEGTGIAFRPAPTNDVTTRLEAVRGTLRRLVDGKPGLMVSRRCKTLRRGFVSGYVLRRLARASEHYHSTPEKNEFSHVHDALQYALMGGGESRVIRKHQRTPAFAAKTPWNTAA